MGLAGGTDYLGREDTGRTGDCFLLDAVRRVGGVVGVRDRSTYPHD
jgi:hypothetical protein